MCDAKITNIITLIIRNATKTAGCSLSAIAMPKADVAGNTVAVPNIVPFP